jgi:amino acid adenylation domain-containing protein
MIHGSKEPMECPVTGAAPVWPDPRWSLAGPTYPRDRCIHEIIEDQVKRAPDADAVVFEQDRLSYRELNRRANQLAHHLLDLGVGPEVPVALFLERSLELAVAVLALLKAGAVSVPLDPDFPRERIAFMMEDSGARMIVTESRLAHHLAPLAARFLYLDQDDSLVARGPLSNPSSGVVADNLCAYVYTSGSTGKPKAVMVTHRIASRIQWSHLNAVKLDERDRTLVTSSVGFGFFLGEFSSGLMRGATAVLARPGGYQDIDYLIDVVERHRITVIAFVPTVLRLFLARMKERGLARGSSLRHIVSQGEALTADLQEDVQRSLGARVHKFYGLTEAPVAAYSNCEATEDSSKITIGRPTNMEFHLLDEQMNPVPIGRPGEIYLGGHELARGYLNRPALSALRFIANPFSREPGARLFRTGDRARWLGDGTLEFLGRGDQQVKIRGVRVDVGEIETILGAHSAILAAAVVAFRDSAGTDRLIAYYVARSAGVPTAQTLREFLAAKVPGSIAPSAFVRLDELPVLANGKVDRRVLAARGSTVLEQAGGGSAGPRDDRERRLIAIWRDLLLTRSIGIDDDFFLLGGTSLQATRMLAEIDREFGVKLPRSALVRASTIEDLARIIQSGRARGLDAESLQLLKPGAGGPGPCLFLVHDGIGETLLYLNLVRRMPEELAVYAIEPHHDDRHPLLDTRIADMAAYYVRQIQRVQPEGPYCLGGMCAGGTIAHEMALQLEADGHTVSFVILFDSVAPRAVLPAGFAARRSWGRFQRALSDRRGRLASSLVTVAKKLVNYAVYQVRSRVVEFARDVRFRGLRAAIESGRPLPWYVRGLPVKEVYIRAMREYEPLGTVKASVVLFPATEGAGDNEPNAVKYSDLRIGWDRWIANGLEICQVAGGHIGMLQEPNVAIVAERLCVLMQHEPPTVRSGFDHDWRDLVP